MFTQSDTVHILSQIDKEIQISMKYPFMKLRPNQTGQSLKLVQSFIIEFKLQMHQWIIRPDDDRLNKNDNQQKWSKEELKMFFDKIQEAKCRMFQMSRIDNPQIILGSIEMVSFPVLKQLFLYSMEIHSLQFLNFIQAPSIQRLSVKKCPVLKTKPLSKTNFPYLKFIQFSQCFIYNVDGLQRFKCSLKNYQSLSITISHIGNKITYFEEQLGFSYLCKLEAIYHRNIIFKCLRNIKFEWQVWRYQVECYQDQSNQIQIDCQLSRSLFNKLKTKTQCTSSNVKFANKYLYDLYLICFMERYFLNYNIFFSYCNSLGNIFNTHNLQSPFHYYSMYSELQTNELIYTQKQSTKKLGTSLSIFKGQIIQNKVDLQLYLHFQQMLKKKVCHYNQESSFFGKKVFKQKIVYEVIKYLNLFQQQIQTLPSEHYQLLLFLIEYFNRNDELITNCYDVDRCFKGSMGPLKFMLTFLYINQKINFNKFFSFNWNHLVFLSFHYCEWFNNQDWKELVEHADNFKNLKELYLEGNNVSEIKEGDIQKFDSLYHIVLCKLLIKLIVNNPLNKESKEMIKKLMRNNNRMKITFNDQ